MFTPTNTNKKMLIYKKAKQRHLSEMDFNSFRNTFTNLRNEYHERMVSYASEVTGYLLYNEFKDIIY